MRFSIIIPVYNVEKYLSKCIDSILPQLHHDDEVILVDDGSTDKSGCICEEYSIAFSNIHTIHKSNGGLSDARNTGIDNAKGEYILLIDSDDSVIKTFLEDITLVLKDTPYDIVNYGYRKINESGETLYTSIHKESMLLSSKAAVQKVLLDTEINNFAWANAYKRHLFNGIRYPVGRLYEDKYTTYLLFDRAESVYVLNKPLYNYLVREGSICNSTNVTRKIKGAIDNICGLLQQYNYAKQYSLPQCADNLSARINTAVTSIVRYLYTINEKEALTSLRNILNGNFEPLSHEVSMFVYHPGIYNLIMKLYKLIK